MANITFAIEDNLLRAVKVLAAQHDTSLNALVRDYFAHLAKSGLSEPETMNGNLLALFDYSVGRIGRREARTRLGADDAKLADMLRIAGFPPPRASLEEEDAMVARASDVVLE